MKLHTALIHRSRRLCRPRRPLSCAGAAPFPRDSHFHRAAALSLCVATRGSGRMKYVLCWPARGHFQKAMWKHWADCRRPPRPHEPGGGGGGGGAAGRPRQPFSGSGAVVT